MPHVSPGWEGGGEGGFRWQVHYLGEICSHLSEKPSKDRFFTPDKLQNHYNEGKGKEKKKERGGRKEKKTKKPWLHS